MGIPWEEEKEECPDGGTMKTRERKGGSQQMLEREWEQSSDSGTGVERMPGLSKGEGWREGGPPQVFEVEWKQQ